MDQRSTPTHTKGGVEMLRRGMSGTKLVWEKEVTMRLIAATSPSETIHVADLVLGVTKLNETDRLTIFADAKVQTIIL